MRLSARELVGVAGPDPAGGHALFDLARHHGREGVEDGSVGGLDAGVVAVGLVDAAKEAAVPGGGVARRQKCDHSVWSFPMDPVSVSVPVSTAVAAPPAEVHALLDDLAAHPRWTDHFL